MFYCALLYFHSSSFAIILMGKRELVDFFVCLPDVALPRGVMGVSAYSLFYSMIIV